MSWKVLYRQREWDSSMAETGISTVFCSRNFARLYFSEPQLFIFRQGRHVAVFVFEQVRDEINGPHYGGLVTNCLEQGFCLEASGALRGCMRRLGVVKGQIRNHPFLKTIKVGTLLKEEPFVFIDLARPQEELEAAITKQHRRCIRKARENGLVVSYSMDHGHLKIFYELYRRRQEEKGRRLQSYAFFEQMFTILNERLVMGIVRRDKKVLAVSLLLRDAGHVFMTYGGMSGDGYEAYAKHLMISQMIPKFKSEGFSKLVLGTGSNGKDSIYHFKRAFTDTEHVIYTYGING